MTILIFERSRDLTSCLIDLIKETAIRPKILTAQSYTDAVILLQKKDAGVVLLDLHFSKNLSMELLQLIKKKDKNIVVIIMHSWSNELSLQHCRIMGADHLIDKYDDFLKIPGILLDISNDKIKQAI